MLCSVYSTPCPLPMDATSKTDARVRVFARLRPAKPEEAAAEMGQMGLKTDPYQ